jgi:hypothetical protein
LQKTLSFTVSLARRLKRFPQINNAREKGRVAYPLKEGLLMATCAAIARCGDFEEIMA